MEGVAPYVTSRPLAALTGKFKYNPSRHVASCKGTERGGRDTSSRDTLSRDISSMGQGIAKSTVAVHKGTLRLGIGSSTIDSGVIFY
jgi:hypothetical protein